MRRLSAILVWLTASSALGGCGLFKAKQPACIRDAGRACTEGFCSLVRSACSKQAQLCQKPAGECDIEVCAEGAATSLRAADHPDEAARSLYECVTRETTCKDVDECFDALSTRTLCAAREAEVATDIAPLLPTSLPTADGSGTAGVVVLPGDDLGCLRCAFQVGGCAASYPDCFSAALAAPGASDSCLDYRACLRTCEQSAGDDARRYAQCVAYACDRGDHSRGKQLFAEYRQCMFERCASCFAPPAP